MYSLLSSMAPAGCCCALLSYYALLLFCGLMQLLNSLSLVVWICGALLYTFFSLLWLLLFYFTRYVPTAYCSYTLLLSFAGSILVDRFEMAEGLSPLATKAFTWLPSSSTTLLMGLSASINHFLPASIKFSVLLTRSLWHIQ